MPSPSVQDAKTSCPAGGRWFVCTSGSRFIGCCTDDPCRDGCSKSDLKPASYDVTYGGRFADQECAAGLFYTCSGTKPPFLGCCKSNPCVAGICPSSDLAAAVLSNNSTAAADFTATFVSSAQSTSTTSTSTVPTGTITATPSPSSTEVLAGSSFHLSTAAIMGVTFGAVVVFLALVAFLVVLLQRRSQPRKIERFSFQKIDHEHLPSTPNHSRECSNSGLITPLIVTESVISSPGIEQSFRPSTMSSPAMSSSGRESQSLLGTKLHAQNRESGSKIPQGFSELHGSSIASDRPARYYEGAQIRVPQLDHQQQQSYIPYRSL